MATKKTVTAGSKKASSKKSFSFVAEVKKGFALLKKEMKKLTKEKAKASTIDYLDALLLSITETNETIGDGSAVFQGIIAGISEWIKTPGKVESAIDGMTGMTNTMTAAINANSLTIAKLASSVANGTDFGNGVKRAVETFEKSYEQLTKAFEDIEDYTEAFGSNPEMTAEEAKFMKQQKDEEEETAKQIKADLLSKISNRSDWLYFGEEIPAGKTVLVYKDGFNKDFYSLKKGELKDLVQKFFALFPNERFELV